VDWTVLAPSLFMETAIGPIVGRPVSAGQPVTMPGGETRYHFVAEHDMAALCVAALSSEAARRRRLVAGGPEALGWRDVVQTYERVLGRTIDARHGDDESSLPLPPALRALLGARPHEADDERGASAADTLGVTLTHLETWVRAAVAMTRQRV
jgi:NADH dehydrogenase